MAAECTPTDVIAMLKHLYTIFDALVLQNDLFKVQTIGDAYIIMSNVDAIARGRGDAQASQRKAEQDAEAMLRMAFEMVRTIAEYKAPHGKPLRMRIGIHYGTVAAGVIGTKKYRYDIFGTDALLGNALESNGVTGGVVVSEAVVPLLAELGGKYALIPHELVRLVDQGEFIGEQMSYQVFHAKRFGLARVLMRPCFEALRTGRRSSQADELSAAGWEAADAEPRAHEPPELLEQVPTPGLPPPLEYIQPAFGEPAPAAQPPPPLPIELPALGAPTPLEHPGTVAAATAVRVPPAAPSGSDGDRATAQLGCAATAALSSSSTSVGPPLAMPRPRPLASPQASAAPATADHAAG
jgi:hypothetical protein